MTAPVHGLRDICQRLRRLEDAIAAERKLMRPDTSGCERTRLAVLLTELDQLLKECELSWHGAEETRARAA